MLSAAVFPAFYSICFVHILAFILLHSLSVFLFVICITLLFVSGYNYHRWPAMMEFFLSGSLPLIEFVICDVISDMANKPLSLSL